MTDRKIICKQKSSGNVYTVYELENYYPDNESGYLLDHNQNVMHGDDFYKNYEELNC